MYLRFFVSFVYLFGTVEYNILAWKTAHRCLPHFHFVRLPWNRCGKIFYLSTRPQFFQLRKPTHSHSETTSPSKVGLRGGSNTYGLSPELRDFFLEKPLPAVTCNSCSHFRLQGGRNMLFCFLAQKMTQAPLNFQIPIPKAGGSVICQRPDMFKCREDQ